MHPNPDADLIEINGNSLVLSQVFGGNKKLGYVGYHRFFNPQKTFDLPQVSVISLLSIKPQDVVEGIIKDIFY